MRHTLTPEQDQFETLPGVIESLSAGFDAKEQAAIVAAAELYWSVREEPSEYPDSILVANQLKTLNADAQTIVAALLGSDVCTALFSEEQVLQKFGSETASLVSSVRLLNNFGLSAPESDYMLGTQDQAEKLRRMLLAMVGDIRAILVKLAFRTQRLHILGTYTPEHAIEVARDTMEIFAPLANRLGLGQLKWEMEDMCFRTLEPETYKRLAKALEESRASREIYIQNFVRTFQGHLLNAGFTSAHVFGRPKHIYSIWKKMRSKRVEFQDLFDVRAVRVLVDSVQECYTVLGIVHSTWQPITREFDDYIANPKDNGYQSLHTAVIGPEGKPVEVQIRTRDMDADAELGVAAHWSYKEGSKPDAQLQRSINELRQLLEYNDDESLVEGFAQQISSDRVYVFTPKGEVVDLIDQSTPLDFAYHVHSEIGHRCRGAKINGRIVPLTTRLKNGDQVEILTTREPSPSRDWLNKSLGFLHSSRARSKVRSWFNVQDHEQHLLDGRAILERELKRAHSVVPIEKITQQLKFEKPSELYVSVARNITTAAQLASAINLLETPQTPSELKEFKTVRKPKSSSDAINVLGVGSLLTQIANCCKPVPYDSIVGYITQGKGVSIHRADCNNMLSLTDDKQERLIEVEWGSESDDVYLVDIAITAYDRQGLLRDVSTVLTNEKVNVVGVNTVSNMDDQTAEMKISVYISSIEALAGVMDRIRQLRNVQSVRRVI